MKKYKNYPVFAKNQKKKKTFPSLLTDAEFGDCVGRVTDFLKPHFRHETCAGLI